MDECTNDGCIRESLIATRTKIYLHKHALSPKQSVSSSHPLFAPIIQHSNKFFTRPLIIALVGASYACFAFSIRFLLSSLCLARTWIVLESIAVRHNERKIDPDMIRNCTALAFLGDLFGLITSCVVGPFPAM